MQPGGIQKDLLQMFIRSSLAELKNIAASRRKHDPALRQLMGDVPKIELFARRKAVGWDVWGNEVESDIQFP